MIHATREQQQRILALLDEISAEQVEQVLESGLLSEVLIANVDGIDYEGLRRSLGLTSLMTQRDWYEKALRKARKFLPQIDRDLAVAVRASRITTTPWKPYAEHRPTLTLAFSHRIITRINWTMEIAENDEYVEKELQEVVTRLFKEIRGW